MKERLKRLRKEKGWTQGDVSRLLGLRGHSTYANWEHGRSEPDHENMRRLAEIFNVTIDYLLEKTDDPDEKVQMDLYEALRHEKLSFDGKELSNEESERILQMIRLMFDK